MSIALRQALLSLKDGRFAMQIPLQIVFEHVDQSDLIESHVREAAGKLEQFYDRITSARVVIGKPQHRHHKGDTYSVRLHLTIPDAADIAVSRDPAASGRHEDIEVTLHDAFDAARRELQDFVRRRQGHVKSHETPPQRNNCCASSGKRPRVHCFCGWTGDLLSSQ